MNFKFFQMSLNIFSRHSHNDRCTKWIKAQKGKNGDKAALATLTSKGDKDVPLSEDKGFVYAQSLLGTIVVELNRYVKTLATNVNKVGIEDLELHVVHSTYKRTKQTARYMEKFDEFTTVKYHEWESLDEFQPEDDIKTVQSRMEQFENDYRKLCTNDPYQVIIFVGHASCMNAILSTLCNNSNLSINNAWVSSNPAFGLPLCGYLSAVIKVCDDKYETFFQLAPSNPNQFMFKVLPRHTETRKSLKRKETPSKTKEEIELDAWLRDVFPSGPYVTYHYDKLKEDIMKHKKCVTDFSDLPLPNIHSSGTDVAIDIMYRDLEDIFFVDEDD